MATIVLDVNGMTCDGCVKAVQKAIAAKDPNAVVVVNRIVGRVAVDGKLTLDEAAEAIRGAGYEAQAAVTG
ncbi:hypothetical protein GCM10008171_22210 [Methylopila jiangsuensis]|uniref:HMA domain-containing protein n=1 Tax=Methylopila jiangsuensis TaxID=586230 RepID=A0A9W6JGU3_9HYPH|nr:heavy-metal-associated domain-containing protein [Methylopila jiangsuensis]MDR6286689.1 copper chaperone CopZ [Methylopila jiangsuensis]GLK76967.1 hypothetical protein GCM10008171_22210 [Methylopila jiangsuensis]